MGSKCLDFFQINFQMIPAKISFLLYGCVLGAHIPFLMVFFVSVGLTTSQAGFINGMRFVTSTIVGPLWGMLADYSGKRKLILLTLCLGGAIPFFVMPWVAKALSPVAVVNNASCAIIFSQAVHVNGTVGNGCLETIAPIDQDNTVLFYVLLCIVLFGSIFANPLPGYIDSIAMNVVKHAETDTTYGAQRIFASLGFSVASFCGGVAADHYNQPGMSRYTSVFYILLPCAVALVPFGWYLVGQSRWNDTSSFSELEEEEENLIKKDRKKSKGKSILHMLIKFDTLFFLATSMISGIACVLYTSYCILLASDVIPNATQTALSLVIVAGTAAEIFIFPFTNQLIRILGGTSVAMTVGIFSYFVRFMIMSYTKQLWMMIAVQTFHAFGFALTWAGMMDYLYDVTPKDIVLTIFLIFQSVHFGAAALVANIGGGYLYEAFGGVWLFRGTGILCGVWAVLMGVYYGARTVKQRCVVILAEKEPKRHHSCTKTDYGSRV